MASYLYEDGLETNRLFTRKLVFEDHIIWKDFFDDQAAIEFIPAFGLSTSAERARHWIERQLIRYEENRFGHQALIDKNTNAFIGQCGLLLQEVDGQPELEVGYHILPRYWGKGYATEAAIMFKEYGLKHQLASSIVSIINVKNFRSQAVARKNGMIQERQSKWMDQDVFIYRTYSNEKKSI